MSKFNVGDVVILRVRADGDRVNIPEELFDKECQISSITRHDTVRLYTVCFDEDGLNWGCYEDMLEPARGPW